MYCSLLSFTNFSYLAPSYSCFLLLPLILYHILFTCYFLLIFITYCGTSCHAVRSPLLSSYMTFSHSDFLCPITLPFNVFDFLFSFTTSTPPILLSFVLYYYLLSYFLIFFHALLLLLSVLLLIAHAIFYSTTLHQYSTTSSHPLSLPHLIFSHPDLLPFILFCILPPYTTTCYSTFCYLLSSFTTFYYPCNFLLLFIIYSTTSPKSCITSCHSDLLFLSLEV